MADTTPAAPLKDLAFGDIKRELNVTRRVLERLPADKFDWTPHEKSMSLGRLAMHVANQPQWLSEPLNKDELDMATPPRMRNDPTVLADVLRTFDEGAATVMAAVARTGDA